MQASALDNDSRHDIHDLIRLFNAEFERSENTVLVRGEDEPVYLPADSEHPRHRVIFAHGFYASALHEIAHWCIAGKARRLLVDYGYWYCPDGRSEREQTEFEQVELKPQALEWAFSLAAGFRFDVSVDNLSGIAIDRAGFRRKVYAQLRHYHGQGFPPRARRFIRRLQAHYGGCFELPAAA